MDTPPQLPAGSPSLAVEAAHGRRGMKPSKPRNHRRGSALVRVLIAVLALAVLAEAVGTGYNVLVARSVVRGAELPAPPFVRVSSPSSGTGSASGQQGGAPAATATKTAAISLIAQNRTAFYSEVKSNHGIFPIYNYVTWAKPAIPGQAGGLFRGPGDVYTDNSPYGTSRYVEVNLYGAVVTKDSTGNAAALLACGIVGPDGKLYDVTLYTTPERPVPPFNAIMDQVAGGSLTAGGGAVVLPTLAQSVDVLNILGAGKPIMLDLNDQAYSQPQTKTLFDYLSGASSTPRPDSITPGGQVSDSSLLTLSASAPKVAGIFVMNPNYPDLPSPTTP